MNTLEEAMGRARRAILASQRDDGAWDGACELGPWSTAQTLIALEYLGHLSDEDASAGARWLRSQQRRDGSFAGYPFARKGDLGVTACAWAALLLSHAPEDRLAAEHAMAWVSEHGGLDAVIELALSGDVSAVFLALAGRIDASELPEPPLAWVLVPQIVDTMMKKLTYNVVLGAIALAIIARRLRGDWGLFARLSCQRAVEILTTFQNENGSFNCVTIATALFASALHATGRPEDRARADRAAMWLLSRGTRNAQGLHFDIFPSDIWTTAYYVRVLLESGVSRADAQVQKGIAYLLRTQSQVLQPAWNNAKPNAVRTGGWAFEDGNPLMPDCDDTAVVLSALGRALQAPEHDVPLPEQLARRIRSAIADGRRWLLDMQNPDGGWASFAWGLPAKAPGPAMTAPFALPLHDPVALVRAFLHPPVILGDPSTEDLTARVLDALATTGGAARAIDDAHAFLRVQQCDSGAWWGRWVVNYLAGTAYVLSGLARAGFDLSDAFVQRAIAWVLAQQNSDGGFGEMVATYTNPALAGKGASTAPLTGLVVTALVEVGLRDRPEVKRAVAYLLAAQRSDGTWPNGSYVAPALPPTAFYSYAPAASYLPLQALALYAHPEQRAESKSSSRWTDALLEPMRQATDPLADGLVAEVYAAHEVGAVNKLLALLFGNDDPIPPDLPAPLRDYFAQTAALPEWADPAQIALAQQLFADYGVQITFGLFFSSLPQAYAAANGAAVLVQTGAMQRNTRQRIFETAQFIFDVLDTGAFAPEGRGIRAAQRVRLMHAAIRLMVLRRTDKPWDSPVRGKPINQEDMAGTLMTFSAVTLEAVRRYGVPVSEIQAEAWIHTWCVIGHYMGVERALMPESLQDAQQLMEAIRRRQWAPSQEGKDLTRALLEMMDRFFTFDLAAFKSVVPTQIRFLAGDHCADLLDLPQTNLDGLLEISADLVRELDIPDHESFLADAMGKIAEQAMKAIVLAEREGKRASFRLPESLRRSVIPHT